MALPTQLAETPKGLVEYRLTGAGSRTVLVAPARDGGRPRRPRPGHRETCRRRRRGSQFPDPRSRSGPAQLFTISAGLKTTTAAAGAALGGSKALATPAPTPAQEAPVSDDRHQQKQDAQPDLPPTSEPRWIDHLDQPAAGSARCASDAWAAPLKGEQITKPEQPAATTTARAVFHRASMPWSAGLRGLFSAV